MPPAYPSHPPCPAPLRLPLACLSDRAAAGLQLLGKVDEKFVEVVDVFEPLEDGTRDKAVISKVCPLASPPSSCCLLGLQEGMQEGLQPGLLLAAGVPSGCAAPVACLPAALQGYDATSHFETEIHDVLDMYRRITGGCTACTAVPGAHVYMLPCVRWLARVPAPSACCCSHCWRPAGKPLDLEKEDLRKRQEAQ